MSKKEIPPLLNEIIQNGKLIGKSGSEREIIGGSTNNNLLTIQGIMDRERPEYTLEIGMAYGISAMLFAMKHKELNNNIQQHYSIDPFQISHWDSCGLLLLEKSELLKYVNYFEAFSAIQLPKWVESKLKFDLIYIDGSHL
ncbi:MAG: class I SAM-dependent methyltransferase, partial [Cytophaga sp.]|uniref:class I SAM-dependent methyltransferase n=1 Tax=Cytophaga sp. TaxID=29535 RepID=UPI003F811B5C